MSISNKVYTLREYEGFTRGIEVAGYKWLPEKTFDELETFILSNHDEDQPTPLELFSLTAKSFGKVIIARNYVGVIKMQDGTVIEILPKIAGKQISVEQTKKIFLNMLRHLRTIQFKSYSIADLQIDRINLFEIFIRMFVDEVLILCKRGLRSTYSSSDNNERYYKGKLNVSQHIKHNLFRRDRFFVTFDEFNLNRPENRLIKSTLLLLQRISQSSINRSLITKLLSNFELIDPSRNYEDDLSRCVSDRNLRHYQMALSWCQVFLLGNSFTAFAGCKLAYALLFPMDQVFESYVAKVLFDEAGTNHQVRFQDYRYHLFDFPQKRFALRPDIVVEREGKIVVLDTKWKLLNSSSRNLGISQADIYQVYVYAKKYNADSVVLLYPFSDDVKDLVFQFYADDDVNVSVEFIDLLEPEKSFERVISKL